MDFPLFCSIVAFFFLEYFLYSGRIFLFTLVVFVSGVLCSIYLYDIVSGFVYFGRVSLEFLWRAGSYFLSVGLRCVGFRSGTFYLGASLG